MENRTPFTTAVSSILFFREKGEQESYFIPAPHGLYCLPAPEKKSGPDPAVNKMIIEAQEKERKRISEELHDNTCQMLSAIKLFIDQLAQTKRPKRKSIKKCSVYLADAVNELRNISHNLKAIWLEETGLTAAIERFIKMMETLKNVSIRLAINGFNESMFDRDTQLVIFRIMQEQVQNILKHAKASEVSILLSIEGNNGLICIRDNGIGASLQTTDAAKGAGLKNIRDRAESIQGVMKIDTAPGKGFLLQVSFPVRISQ